MSTIFDRAVRALQPVFNETGKDGYPLAYCCDGPCGNHGCEECPPPCEHRACTAVRALGIASLLHYGSTAAETQVDGGAASTALDQLKLADDLAETREQLHLNALAAAGVHAQLELAQVIREAGIQLRGWRF